MGLLTHLQVPGAQAEAEGPLACAAGESRHLVPQNADQVISHKASGNCCLGVPCPFATETTLKLRLLNL